MNRTNATFSLSALVLGVSLLTAATDAQAVDRTRTLVVNPTGACQSALPVFDGNIRKRPKAVQNEGASSAFVTCSYYSQSTVSTSGNPRSVVISASTSSDSARLLSCTGVLGRQGTSFPLAVKNAVLPGGGELRTLTWDASDFGGTEGGPFGSGLFGVSCSLDPAVGLHDAVITYIEDVGA